MIHLVWCFSIHGEIPVLPDGFHESPITYPTEIPGDQYQMSHVWPTMINVVNPGCHKPSQVIINELYRPSSKHLKAMLMGRKPPSQAVNSTLACQSGGCKATADLSFSQAGATVGDICYSYPSQGCRKAMKRRTLSWCGTMFFFR